MTESHRERLDIHGTPLRKGDLVRIMGVPDLRTMPSVTRGATTSVFRHLLGTVKRIKGFDESEMAELCFKIRKGPHRGLHIVGIEPCLLRRQRRRPGRKAPRHDH